MLEQNPTALRPETLLHRTAHLSTTTHSEQQRSQNPHTHKVPDTSTCDSVGPICSVCGVCLCAVAAGMTLTAQLYSWTLWTHTAPLAYHSLDVSSLL